MSSVARSKASTPSGSGFFTVVGTTTLSALAFTPYEIENLTGFTGTVQNLGSVLNVTSGAAPNTATVGVAALLTNLAAAADTNNRYFPATVSTGNILRDMGKTLYVQWNGANVVIFKYVTVVNNVTGEGINPSSTSDNGFYLPIWAADPSANTVAKVARTGY